MGILSSLFSPQPAQIEQRGMSGLSMIGDYGASMAGIGVSEQSSLRNMAVFACVGIISQSLASVPLATTLGKRLVRSGGR